MFTVKEVLLLVVVAVGLSFVHDARGSEGDLWFDLHGVSKHTGSPVWYDGKDYRKWNEINIGGGISYEMNPNLEASAGFFNNSFYKPSVYAGLDLHTTRAKFVSAGLAFGPISGYTNTPTKTLVFVLPNVVFTKGKFRARVGYMPVGISKAITFSIGVKL